MKYSILGVKPSPGKSNLRILNSLQELADTVLYARLENIYLEVGKRGDCVFYKGKNLCEYDVIYPRIGGKYKEIGYLIMRAIEDKVYTPVSSDAILTAHNKYLSLEVMRRAGLPVPRTYLAKGKEMTEEIFDEIKFPVIVKLLSGHGGQGIMFASTEKEAQGIIDTLHAFNELIFVEEFVENPGEDIRAFVIGDEVPASMKRVAKKGEFRANIKAGGKGVKHHLTEEQEDIALKASEALGAGICGIDMIEGAEGPVIIEVNVCPGIRGISEATGKDVSKLIAEYLVKVGKK